MSDFEIEEELLKKNHRFMCGVAIYFILPDNNVRQYKEIFAQKYKNVL
jgi:hypothetical protein